MLVAAALVLRTGGASTATAVGDDGTAIAALVYEAVNVGIPLTNPTHIGAPSPSSWGWPLLVGVIVEVARITPFQAMRLLSAAAIAVLVVTSWSVAGLHTRRLWVRVALVATPFAILNPLAPMRLVYLLLARWGQDGLPFDRACCLQPHDALDPAPGSLFAAFLQPTALPVGLAAYAVVLYALVRPRWGGRARVLVVLLLGMLAGIVWPPTGLVLVLTALGGLLSTALDQRPLRPELIARDAAPSLGLLAGLAVPLPLLLAGGVEPPRVALFEQPLEAWADIGRVGWALLPAVPLYVAGWRRRAHLVRTTRLLLAVGTVLGAGALVFASPHRGEAELVVHFALPTSFLALGLLDELVPGWRGTTGPGARLRARIVAAATTFGVASVASTVLLWRLSDVATEDRYVSNGTAVELHAASTDTVTAHRQLAYRWLRERTPATSYVLEAPRDARRLDLSVVAQRRTVVALPSRWSAGTDGHDELVERARHVVAQLRACALTTADLVRLASLPEPWPPSLYAVARRAGPGDCTDLPPGVAAVYDNPDWVVYVIDVPNR